MTCDEFEKTVKRLYERLPKDIRERFSLEIEEYWTEFQMEQMRLNPGKYAPPFGYVSGLSPDCVVLLYQTFKANGDFSEAHIDRVIKHEYEHVIRGVDAHHSEH